MVDVSCAVPFLIWVVAGGVAAAGHAAGRQPSLCSTGSSTGGIIQRRHARLGKDSYTGPGGAQLGWTTHVAQWDKHKRVSELRDKAKLGC